MVRYAAYIDASENPGLAAGKINLLAEPRFKKLRSLLDLDAD